jgi:hypothetical protein
LNTISASILFNLTKILVLLLSNVNAQLYNLSRLTTPNQPCQMFRDKNLIRIDLCASALGFNPSAFPCTSKLTHNFDNPETPLSQIKYHTSVQLNYNKSSLSTQHTACQQFFSPLPPL